MTEAVVEIAQLGHVYMSGTPLAQTALHDVSMAVRRAEVVALVGPTGSGKSTLLQYMNGLFTPRTGSVRVLGRDLSDGATHLTLLRREVGLVLQDPGQQVFERYVGDDVAFGPRMAGLSGRDLTVRVRWAMDQVGLDFEEFRDRPTFALSGGERRKVGLAGVVALKPEILLVDEPAAGLDPEAHDEMLDCLSRLNRGGMTVVMATHSMDDVAALAHRVVVMDRGRVVMDGPVRQVFGRVEEIRSLGLALPEAAEVAHELALRGVAVRRDVLNLEEAELAILEALEVRQ